MHISRVCSQAEWSRYLLPRIVHSMARSSRWYTVYLEKFD